MHRFVILRKVNITEGRRCNPGRVICDATRCRSRPGQEEFDIFDYSDKTLLTADDVRMICHPSIYCRARLFAGFCENLECCALL